MLNNVEGMSDATAILIVLQSSVPEKGRERQQLRTSDKKKASTPREIGAARTYPNFPNRKGRRRDALLPNSATICPLSFPFPWFLHMHETDEQRKSSREGGGGERERDQVGGRNLVAKLIFASWFVKLFSCDH